MSQDPWDPSQPYLKQNMQTANALQTSGQGFNPYPGSTTIPFSAPTTQAMSGMMNLAAQGNPLGDAAYGSAQSLIQNQGMTPEMRQALGQTMQTAQGGNQIGGAAQYGQLFNDADANLGAYARGDYLDGGSPMFQQALNYQSGQLTDDINRGFSNSGRYGSASHVNEVGDNVGRFRNQAQAQELMRQQALQQQAQGALNQQQAGAIAGGAGIQGQNISNMVNNGNIYAQQAGQGINAAANAANQGANYYGQMTLPMELQGTVGAMYEDLATRQAQESVDRYNALQQAPWQAMANANAIYAGAGQLGNTQTTQVTAPSRLSTGIQGALGGLGATAGSAVSPWLGLGLGALGGGFG